MYVQKFGRTSLPSPRSYSGGNTLMQTLGGWPCRFQESKTCKRGKKGRELTTCLPPGLGKFSGEKTTEQEGPVLIQYSINQPGGGLGALSNGR